MKHQIQPTFLRNEGVGKLYKATINQAELGVVTGVQVKLEADYKYVALGALYYDGTELVRPTRPWRDSIAFDGEYGNIPAFHGNMSKYSFGPATSEETVLYWHKFIEDDGTTLLVCDRNLIHSITWNQLNNAGFIFGKEIELEGGRYLCRVLTGGDTRREGGTERGYIGGKLPNEWDRYVLNGADLGAPIFGNAPTPVPEDYPNESVQGDPAAWARPHNQAWNWNTMYSWCQELATSGRRVHRGDHTAAGWNHTSASGIYNYLGWRPVLELL